MPVCQPRAGLLLQGEQVEGLAQQPVVALLGLLEEAQVLVQPLGVGKDRAVDALQRMVRLVTLPVGGGHAQQLEVLQQPGRRQVRSAAEVDEVALPVNRNFIAGDLLVEQLGLERLAALQEMVPGLGLGPELPEDGEVLLGQVGHFPGDDGQVVLGEGALGQKVVVEAVLHGRPDAVLRVREQLENRLGQEVGGGMAVNVKGLRGMGKDLLDLVAGSAGRSDGLQLAVYLQQDRFFFFHVTNRRGRARTADLYRVKVAL